MGKIFNVLNAESKIPLIITAEHAGNIGAGASSKIWRAYHDRIREKIIQFGVANMRPLFVSIHTMKPSWAQDVALLYDRNVRAAASIRDKFAMELPEIIVGVNEQFNANLVKGVLGIQAEPFALPCVEIEFNQRLFLDRAKQRRCVACVEDWIDIAINDSICCPEEGSGRKS